MNRSLRWATGPALLLCTLAVACGGGSAPATAAAPVAAQGAGGITSALSSQLGITGAQAEGGIGSMLNMAKGKLSPADYDKVTKAIPNSSKYLQASQDAGVTAPITSVDGLNQSFSKLGMSPEAAKQFGPAVADYVGKSAGGPTGSLLSGLLK